MRVTVVKILSNKTQHSETIQKGAHPKRFFIQTLSALFSCMQTLLSSGAQNYRLAYFIANIEQSG